MDASDQIVEDMKAGWIDSLVVQNPFRMGYESVKAIGMHLRGGRPPAVIDSGVALILPEQLDQPSVKELLFPDVQRYLKAQ